MLTFLKQHYQTCLLIILCFSFITRIYSITNPSGYIFDEVYHALTAKLISRNDVRAYEWWNEAVEPNTAVDWLHPPLAKYFQAASISVFGENALGWRFSSVIFGVLVIYATSRLSLLLLDNKVVSLLAAVLASFDGLLLTQSRIAMNDIHVTFFILLTLILYIKHRNFLSTQKKDGYFSKYIVLTGLVAGLAMASKWSGVYALLPVCFLELLFCIEKIKILSFKQKIAFLLQRFCLLILLPFVVYVSSYAHMFMQGKTLICTQETSIQGQCYYEEFFLPGSETPIWQGYVSHFVELHRQIWWYQTNLEATHPYQSRPLEWILNMRPVWYHVEYRDDLRGDIYAQGNTALFLVGIISVTTVILYLLQSMLTSIRAKNISLTWKNNVSLKLFYLILSYFSVWFLWQFSPRIMFFYHYTPAVPLLCILVAYWLEKLLESKTKVPKVIAITIIAVIAANFVLFYPNWTGIPVRTELKDNVYFFTDKWK